MKCLEDLKNFTEEDVKNHLISEYADISTSGFNKSLVGKYLEHYNVLVAYESVGSWGCDSSSYFLLQHQIDETFVELSGSHCSCSGFEGQFDPVAATVEYLQSDKFHFYTGGYDEHSGKNTETVKQFMMGLGNNQ